MPRADGWGPAVIVLHSDALLCAALAEPRSEWVITQIVHDDLAAPSHQPTWVLGALLALAGRGLLDDGELGEAFSAVLTLPQELHAPDAGLVGRARDLTAVMPFLDGLHVALAERLDVPLVLTAAGRLGAADEDGVRCQMLSPPAWLYPDHSD